MELKLIKDYIQYLKFQKNYSDHTINSYFNDLKQFFTFAAEYLQIDLDENIYSLVDDTLARSFLAKRFQQGYNNNSNKRFISSVKNFYAFLEKKHNIINHKIQLISSPKKAKTLPKSLSNEEIKKAIDNISNHINPKNPKWINARNKALLILLYASAMRISEALQLTKKHLDNKNYLIIKGKGNKERVIPWVKKAYEVICEYLELLPYKIDNNEPIFKSLRGKILNRTAFNKILIDLRRQLNLPEYFTPHALRHSCASHLLSDGANLRSIQELLGHENLSTTQIYTKINNKYLENAYDKFHPESHNNKKY